MKLENAYFFTQIFAGLAVVVLLIFVGYQIRENNNLNRVIAYDRNIDSLNAVRTLQIQDRTLQGIYQAYQKGQFDSLDEIDFGRLRSYVSMIFGVYEKTYFSYRVGILGEAEWDRYERNICIHNERINSTTLRPEIERVVTGEFLLYMDALCENGTI